MVLVKQISIKLMSIATRLLKLMLLKLILLKSMFAATGVTEIDVKSRFYFSQDREGDPHKQII